MSYKDKTPQQQQNFRTLLNGLIDMYGDKRFDPHFDMWRVQRVGGGKPSDFLGFNEAVSAHACDTSACSLGHGPIFGITPDGYCNDWSDYADSCFGLSDTEGLGWDFLFSEWWTDDIQEAIARLKMYIDGFDPNNEEWGIDDLYAEGWQDEMH